MRNLKHCQQSSSSSKRFIKTEDEATPRLLFCRRSLLHPSPILLVRGISNDGSPAGFLSPAQPPVGFGMAVGKRKATAAVVVSPGSVKPLGQIGRASCRERV